MKDILYYAQLALESVVSVFGLRPYEEPKYAVIGAAQAAEIRRYAPRIAAEASVAGEGEAASEAAFRALFGYISGGEKIAMTTPVASRSSAGSMRMQFFLPARYSAETAPPPSDPRIRVLALPEATLAVVRFSGRGTPEAVAERRGELLAALASSGWRPVGEPVVLFYDPPFTIPFLRRNEVAVEVAPR